MKQHISALALLVPGYDEAIAYYVERLGFELVEDTVTFAHKALGGGRPARKQRNRPPPCPG